MASVSLPTIDFLQAPCCRARWPCWPHCWSLHSLGCPPPPTLQSPSVSVTFVSNWHSRTRLSQRTHKPDFLSRPSIGCQTSKAWLNSCTISFGNSSLKMSRKHMCFHSGSPDRDLGLDLRHCQCEAQLGSSWLLASYKNSGGTGQFYRETLSQCLGASSSREVPPWHLLCEPMGLGAQLLLCPI